MLGPAVAPTWRSFLATSASARWEDLRDLVRAFHSSWSISRQWSSPKAISSWSIDDSRAFNRRLRSLRGRRRVDDSNELPRTTSVPFRLLHSITTATSVTQPIAWPASMRLRGLSLIG